MDVSAYVDRQRRYLEQHLKAYLPPTGQCPDPLLRAMEYSLFAGGKRLRPVLALAAAEACGGSRDQALAPAIALEMIHTYSLIHDDLPAMDDDDMRRGKPTCHKVFGEAMAILAGDALLTHAFAVVASSDLPPARVTAIVRELATAAGPVGMVAGQVMDVAGVEPGDVQRLQHIHGCKTGALIRAAVRCGAMAVGAGSAQLRALHKFAEALGLAYQIVDDILDVTGDSKEMGKTAGSDARLGKQTFVTLYGVEGAKELAAAQSRRAVAAFDNVNGDFQMLKEIALLLAARTS